MFKLIAMDMDGTLLNCYGDVSKENKEAISLALSKNIEVVIASGRIPNAILSTANKINANKYMISGNGAQVYDIQNDEIIYSNYLSKEKVLEIIEKCETNSMFYTIYTNDAILTKTLNYNILFYNSENKKNPEDKQINIKVVSNLQEYINEYQGEDFLKVVICDSDESVFKNIINTLKTIEDVDVLEVSHLSKKIIQCENENIEITYFYTEITNKNVNKWTAIEKLIEKLDIKKEEVLTIGDNINDKEMIENAGYGIVTGNGSQYMKEIANEVVGTNDENGVAQAIMAHI